MIRKISNILYNIGRFFFLWKCRFYLWTLVKAEDLEHYIPILLYQCILQKGDLDYLKLIYKYTNTEPSYDDLEKRLGALGVGYLDDEIILYLLKFKKVTDEIEKNKYNSYFFYQCYRDYHKPRMRREKLEAII